MTATTAHSALRIQFYPDPHSPATLDIDDVNAEINPVTHVAGPLVITTRTLPRGHVHKRYRKQLHRSGGTGPYIWTLSSGHLPTGIHLSSHGLITGKPRRSTTRHLKVRLTDTYQQITNRHLTLHILRKS